MDKVAFTVSGETTEVRSHAAFLARKAIESGKKVAIIHLHGEALSGGSYASVYLHSDGYVSVVVPDGGVMVDLREAFTLDTALRVAHGWLLAD